MKRKFTFRNLLCFSLLLSLAIFQQGEMLSQCANDNVYYMDVTTDGDGDVAMAPCVYGGDYLVAMVCANVSYDISMCGAQWDTQITLYDGDGNYITYDDDGCGAGASEIFYTATFTGPLVIVVDEYDCETLASCAVLTVTQYGNCGQACTNNNALYNVNATPSGAGSTVTVTNMYAGEYVNVSVCSGASYTFEACSATYDSQLSLVTTSGTLLAYDDDGCGTFAGPSVITWVSDITGTVRLLLDQWPCASNTVNTTVLVTQETACPATCTVSSASAFYNSCFGTQEWVDFYVNYSGTCTVETLSLYSPSVGWQDVDLSGFAYGSGEAIGIYLPEDNTTYTFYFTLSNGNTSLQYEYTTGICPLPTCSFTDVDYLDLGCDGTYESVIFYPYYTGACSVAGLWTYTTAGGWQYADLSANGYTSGDAVGMFLTADNTLYEYYFVLDNGVESNSYFYTTGTCDVTTGCSIPVTQENSLGCVGDIESMDFYAYYTGDCNVYSVWFFTEEFGWEESVMQDVYGSGDPMNFNLLLSNTSYSYYVELSDGTTSDITSFISANCNNQPSCTNLFIDYTDTGCVNTGVSNVPSGNITPFYTGGCTVEGIYSSVNGAAFTYLDLSAYGFESGDDIGLFFNIQDADYEVYFVLSDGTESPSTFFTTEACESGETICDCAGTQLPIESLAWLGDGSLDDGGFFWGGDTDLPVDFNCATWGFDCGDEIPAGYFAYDPYGTCSGVIPPGNGCVDEFCYNIDVDVSTDCHPEDIQVAVFNEDGYLVFTASADDFITASDNLYTFSMCLPAGCYNYQVTDEFGDGLAGSDCLGVGYTGIYDYSVNSYVVFANGDEYTSIFSDEFCVGPQTICDNLEMNIFTGACFPTGNGSELLPTISYVFDFSGPCSVQSLFYSVDGADFVELDVSANNWGSGDEGVLYYLQPNSSYTLFYTTNDGASSYLYDFTTEDCNNEITICDCDGTQLSIGVTDWLGDGFADNSFYLWAGQYVNFNCATWGYDCGDIEGAPAFDPYNVCDGQLPPFNGCIETNEVLGCTDPSAINYNPQATINDGSCIYNLQVGCTDPDACNYNDLAIVDNGTCEYISCVGCTDDTATNYDPTATIDDGSCIYIEIEGCTDQNALNYDPLATQNDGSCIYNCVWPTVAYDSHCTQGDLTSFYIDIDLNALGNGSPYTITNSYNNQQQVMTLLGSVTMGPFPNGTPVVIQVTSNTIDCLLTSQPMAENCSVAGIYGCTDDTALNYNPDATIDDGSCLYDVVEEIGVAHFSMYPNPAKDQVTLVNGGSAPLVQIRIMDNTGRLVLNEQAMISNGSGHTINVNALAQGNYVVEVMTEGNIEHHSLIIQK